MVTDHLNKMATAHDHKMDTGHNNITTTDREARTAIEKTTTEVPQTTNKITIKGIVNTLQEVNHAQADLEAKMDQDHTTRQGMTITTQTTCPSTKTGNHTSQGLINTQMARLKSINSTLI